MSSHGKYKITKFRECKRGEVISQEHQAQSGIIISKAECSPYLCSLRGCEHWCYLIPLCLTVAVKWQSFVCLFWLCWVFIVVHELFVKASGFSLQWLFLLQSTGSRVHGFSRCSMQVELPCGMWDFSSLTRD